jgi:hypothetical protein
MLKASRLHRSLLHRKNETLRQYILRAREDGLWPDEVAREGLLVWLDTYDSVRFGGVELTEGEFLSTMKLVYYLLLEMRPPENYHDTANNDYAVESVISSSSSSSFSLGDSDSVISFGADPGLLPPLSKHQSTRHSTQDADVLRQMESLLTQPTTKSGETASLQSMIDHGSILEQVIDREEIDRRMRGGRLGEREGSVIYYDVDDDD